MTDNVNDFPTSKVPGHLQVLKAKEFAANTAAVDPERAARALCEIARRHTKARHTPHQLVGLLVARYGMDDVAEIVLPILDDVVTEFDA